MRPGSFPLLYFPLFPAACEDSRASPAAIEKRRRAVPAVPPAPPGQRICVFTKKEL